MCTVRSHVVLGPFPLTRSKGSVNLDNDLSSISIKQVYLCILHVKLLHRPDVEPVMLRIPGCPMVEYQQSHHLLHFGSQTDLCDPGNLKAMVCFSRTSSATLTYSPRSRGIFFSVHRIVPLPWRRTSRIPATQNSPTLMYPKGPSGRVTQTGC